MKMLKWFYASLWLIFLFWFVPISEKRNHVLHHSLWCLNELLRLHLFNQPGVPPHLHLGVFLLLLFLFLTFTFTGVLPGNYSAANMARGQTLNWTTKKLGPVGLN